MSRFKLSLYLLLLIFGCLDVSGQAERTPFSAFGYGDTFNNALNHNQGMGGVGVSNPQHWYLNNLNPAMLTYNRITVFQAGMLIDRRRIYSDTLREKTSGGNLNYLSLGFPVLRNKKTDMVLWSTAIGLMPVTNVNYRYQYTDTVPGTTAPIRKLERGQGGFDEFYWSNGVRLNKYISLGLKTSFLFSSVATDISNVVEIPNQTIPYLINVHELQSAKGVTFTPGIHIRKDSIKNRYVFNFGATYNLVSKIHSNLEQILERRDADDNILESDTTQINTSDVRLNRNLTMGASFGRSDRWMVAADVTLLRPSGSFATLGLDRTPVSNGLRFAVGAELTPDARAFGSYLKHITYRTGISLENGTYLVNGNPVRDFGINFGFSFPVNQISSLDIAFRTGKRGDFKLNGIEENYFKIYFGVTFNDKWFIKRRFD